MLDNPTPASLYVYLFTVSLLICYLYYWAIYYYLPTSNVLIKYLQLVPTYHFITIITAQVTVGSPGE